MNERAPVRLKPAQCRAARAMLGLSQAALADSSRVSRATLADFEAGKRTPNHNNLAFIQAAIEGAGVVLVDGGGHGPSVRLRDPLPVPGRERPGGRTGDVVRVVLAAAELAGGIDEAAAWFENEPLADLGGRTAAELVADGHAEAVLAFIRDLADGSKG